MRELAKNLIQDFRISQRRARRVIVQKRTTFLYQAKPRDNRMLTLRIKEITEIRLRYGMWRILTLLRREGWKVNHKRVHRLYELENLNLRSVSHRVAFLFEAPPQGISESNELIPFLEDKPLEKLPQPATISIKNKLTTFKISKRILIT